MPPLWPLASPRRCALLGLALALLALGAAPTLSVAYTIEPGHPRLYFTAADLSTLRARTTTTHATQWLTLLNWPQPRAMDYATDSGRDMTRTHQYIERNAFMYLMLAVANPGAADLKAQTAHAWLMELASYDFAGNPNDAFEFIWALAIGYDWLFTWPGFSETDKQIVRAKLIERTTKQVNETGLNGFPDFPTGPETSKSIYDNMSTENNMASGLAGLALWEAGDPHGTNADAQRFLDATYYRFREMYAATRAHAPDGGWWEGQGYYGARLQGEVFFALTWLVATGEDLLANNEHLQNAVYYWIYGLRPDGVSSREGDQTCLPQGCARNRHIASILAAYYADPHVQWYAQYQGALTGAGWEEVVLYDVGVPAQPPSTLPLHRRFKFGHIVIRTGWDIGPGSDDTYFTFDIHDWVSGHTHVDSGSFTLFRRGALAIDSGRYRGDNAADNAHERNYATRTIAHNTITVYRAGESFGGFANDGGQEFLFQETPLIEPRFTADLAAGTRFDMGTTEAFEAAPDHYYLKGNVTDAYHSTGFQAPSDGAAAKISHFTREIAFFPDEPDPLVVVFDRVTSLQAAWPKRWLLHAIEEPQVSGPVTSTEVPGHILTQDSDLVTIDRAGGRLFSRTLLPAASRVRKVGGAGYEFWLDDPGKNYPLSVVDAEAGAWRVEVRPVVASTADTFLHVLSVATNGVAAMPATRLIDAGTAYGAEAGDRVVLFAKTSTPVQNVDYTVESSGPAVRHLLTGMVPGLYGVTRNGVPVSGSPLTTSGERTLGFQTPGGVSVSVRWVAGRADLVVTGQGSAPAGLNPGATFTVSDTVTNTGSATAGASSTRYYLSVDTVLSPGDIPVTGERAVTALGPGATSTGSATVTVPADAPHGLYFILACADGAGVAAENSESNNCRASTEAVRVGVADLVVTAVSNPPATIRAGLSFQATATAGNFGSAASPASTLRYFLSLDTARDGADVLMSGSRSVPALIPGAQAGGPASVTVPAATPPGFYHLLGCADGGGVVVESDELDNCLASALTVDVRVPDLVVTSVSATPSGVGPGSSFTVSDTTANQGVVDAAASRTRYYLSADTQISADDRLLTGSRQVPILVAGTVSSGNAVVTVPAATPLGSYHVVACADDLRALSEVSESNNCAAAAGVVIVGRPDLVVSAVSVSPGPVAPGGTLGVMDTVHNQGSVGAGGSKTRFYLSKNTSWSANDTLLAGTRQVLPLVAGGTSSGPTTVTLPSSVVPGDFFVLACADDLKVVAESEELNNCSASAAMTVGAPDLAVREVGNPPATVKRGKKLPVSDTTENLGNASTGRTTRTRYYLSSNQTWSVGDKLLTGYRQVGDLGPGDVSSGSVSVTVPTNTTPTDYYLLACADDTALVVETNEANNCESSTTRVTVQP